MEANSDFSFGKNYRLCSQKVIAEIFDSGVTVKSFPFVAMIKEVNFSDESPFKVVISAPKKKFRNAHQRNRAKRICREAIRLNKHYLEEFLTKNNKQIAIFLIYTSNEELKHDVLQRKAKKLFNTIIKQLDELH